MTNQDEEDLAIRADAVFGVDNGVPMKLLLDRYVRSAEMVVALENRLEEAQRRATIAERDLEDAQRELRYATIRANTAEAEAKSLKSTRGKARDRARLRDLIDRLDTWLEDA